MKILVKWPTRSRPIKFLRTLFRYQETRVTDDVDFLITIDKDDASMTTPEVLSVLRKWGNLRYEIIEPCGKIGAINYGLDKVNEKYDIILLASDDMIPAMIGWDKRIGSDMAKYFPDTDGVLWYNDGKVGRKLNTLSIVGTKYYRRFGYIYHPDYKALWCDNEFMEVANLLGKQQYIEDVIIRHEHPIWGHGVADSLNERDNKLYTIDQKTYEDRKNRGFGLTPPIIEYFDTDASKPAGDVSEPSNGAEPANKRKRGRPSGAGSKLVGQSDVKHRRQA